VQINAASSTNASWTAASGGSLSYTTVRQETNDEDYRSSLYVARAQVGASPSAFTVTADAISTGDNGWYSISCVDITGHDTTTPIVGTPVGNNAEGLGGSDSASSTVTLGATPTAGNLIVVVYSCKADSGGGFRHPDRRSGKTFTAAVNQNAGYTQNAVFYRVADGAESTTITCSDMGQAVYGWTAAAFEIAAGASGVTGTSAQTLAAATSSASGWVNVTGTVAVTLAAFTSAATGTLTFTGTSAQTLRLRRRARRVGDRNWHQRPNARRRHFGCRWHVHVRCDRDRRRHPGRCHVDRVGNTHVLRH